MARLRRPGPGRAAIVCALALGACDLPDQPEQPAIEIVYLLDDVDGEPPPAPVCQEGTVVQLLRFESIALAEDGSYGRAQEVQVGTGTPFRNEERGDFERSDSSIILRNGAGALVTLAFLDSAGARVRRIHGCGDTLGYESVPILED